MARWGEQGDRSSLPVFGTECFTEGSVFPCTNIARYSSSCALGNYLEQVSTGWHILAEAPAFAELLDLGLLTPGTWVEEGALGRPWGSGLMSEPWAGVAGGQEGEQRGGRREVRGRLLGGKWLKPQMFPGEVRGRVRGAGCRGHGGSGGGEVGRVMLLWLLLCYS